MPAPNHRNRVGLSRDMAEEYCDRYPDLPSRGLARLMIEENPDDWVSLNAACLAVRRARGALGKRSRHRATHAPSPAHAPHTAGPGAWAGNADDPLDLIPDGTAEFTDYKPHVIDARRIGCLYDVHVPYHEAAVVRLACEYFKEHEIDHLFLGGDFVDFYQLSRFQKDPQRRDLEWELTVARQMLDALRRIFPEAGITYLMGNHEERLASYLAAEPKALASLSSLHLDRLLDFEKYGVVAVPRKHYAKAGHLNFIHGHEFGQRSCVAPARSLVMKARENVMCGHWHKPDDHTGITPISRDRTFAAWSVGTCATIRPDYMVFNEHCHGFAYVEVDEAGDFRVQNHRVIDGVIY